MQGSYIGYYSSFPSFGGGFDSRTLLQKNTLLSRRQKRVFYAIRFLRIEQPFVLCYNEFYKLEYVEQLNK